MNNKNSVAKDYERGTRIANRRKELGMTQDERHIRLALVDRHCLRLRMEEHLRRVH